MLRPLLCRALVSIVSLLLAAGVLGCGSSSPTAVGVGSATISRAAVDHWELIARREAAHSGSRPRGQALDFLIFSDWLIGAAAEAHVAATSAEVSRRVENTRTSGLPGVESTSYLRALRRTGRTPADVRFEVETEIAYRHLRESVLASAAPVGPSEVLAYFNAHRRRYVVSERRYIEIDNVKSQANALRVKAEIKAGRSFAAISLHEVLSRATAFRVRGKVMIERAIFAAKPGELVGPIAIEPFENDSIFIVRRIVPSRLKTFVEAKGDVEALLGKAREQTALARFNAALRAKWAAATDCRPGFVMERCRQYRGPAIRDSAFALELSGLWTDERPSLPG
jgi:hypothetical protein